MRNWLTAVLILGLGGAAFGQTIRLKPLSTVELRQDVRVGDVASVTGEGASEVANTVLVAGIEKSMQVKAETVLMAVVTQRGRGAGNLQLGGAAVCQIELNGAPQAVAGGEKGVVDVGGNGAGVKGSAGGSNVGETRGGAGGSAGGVKGGAGATSGGVKGGAAGSAGGAKGEQVGNEVSDAGEGTLRDVIVKKLLRDSGVAEEDLRVEFNTTNPLVDSVAGAGQRWLVRPLTRTLLGTVQFEAQLAEGTKVVQRINVPTEVKRRQRVVVAAGRLLRGDVVTSEGVKYADVWMDRNMPTMYAAAADVIGLEAQRDMDAESPLDQRDFKPLLMAHKGDQVTVVYLAGPLEVQVKGRALADARFHEMIDVRNDAGDKIGVMMVKKGVGVAGAMTAEQEKRVREAL